MITKDAVTAKLEFSYLRADLINICDLASHLVSIRCRQIPVIDNVSAQSAWNRPLFSLLSNDKLDRKILRIIIVLP